MTGFLLGLCFGAGVALIWLGVVAGVRLSRPTTPARLNVLLRDGAIGVPALVFVVIVVACAVSAGLLVWWIIDVPALVAAGVLGGAHPDRLGSEPQRPVAAGAGARLAGSAEPARRRA